MKNAIRSLVPAAALAVADSAAAVLAAFPGFEAYTIGQVGNQMGQTSLVDVDHDGDLDWMVGDRGTVWWFEYQAAGTWVQHTVGTTPLTDVGGTAFDVDGDGWVDHVTAGAWFRNPRTPRTSSFARFEVGGITNAHDCVAADVDGDGKLDLVAMSDKSGVYWYKIPADPTQKWTAARVGDGVHGGIGPRGVGDLDGDGDADIVRSTGWFENAGKGASWVWHGNLAAGGHGGTYPNTTKSWIVDLDRDGDNDVVMADADVFTFDARVHWFENADGKGLTWKEHVVATGKGDLHTLALADFDNDGDLDIFSGEGPGGGTGANGARRWFVWENLDGRGGSWTEHLLREDAAECHEGVAADVDRDGDVDLCSKPWNGNLHVYLRNNLNPGTVQPPDAPSNLAAAAASSSQINLSWTDNSTNESGFKIERKTGSAGTWGQIATVGAGVTAYSNTGLSASTTYYYRVRAYNSAGDSAYSNEASATTQATVTVPSAPSNLAATPASSSQINLSWTDNSSNESGFKIERKTGSAGTWGQIATIGAGVIAYSNTGLSASTTYYYRVRATNSAGDSAYSNETSATTWADPNGPGLRGDYYENLDFTGLVLSRTDPQINFDWGTGAPAGGMGADTFSVRWTGRLQAEFSEVYTFTARTDDGVRLWVNGELLIDQWVDQSPKEYSGSLALQAGGWATIQMDYYENGGGAVAQLFWESPSTPKQLIPPDRLSPQTGPADPRDPDGDGIPNDEDPDDDGDGIPDLEDADRDGDGWANAVEDALGTDPDDPHSFPEEEEEDAWWRNRRCGATGVEFLAIVGMILVGRRLAVAFVRRESHGWK